MWKCLNYFKSYHFEAFFLNQIMPIDCGAANPCRQIHHIVLTKSRTHK